MTKFIHTADWQLGMTRHFLDGEAQARYTQARIDAIRAIGDVASERGCDFILVCGDVFESNYLDRQVVARALDAIGSCPVPTFLLPGNHDPLDTSSIYHSPAFASNRPQQLHVIESSEPIAVADGVEIVGAPWFSKRPTEDLAAKALADLEPMRGAVRILAAHGAVDSIIPDRDNPALISLSALEDAIERGAIHYVALGDRHSLTSVGRTGRVWYAGASEQTDFREIDPGKALVAELSETDCKVDPVHVGTWTFHEPEIPVSGVADLELLESQLSGIQDKNRAIVRLRLHGNLNVVDKTRLDSTLDRLGDLFASLELRGAGLTIVPADTDFSELGLAGFAADALGDLRDMASANGDDAKTAQDALSLLYRLAQPE